MAGASLIPDFYKSKMKLCVMLAPPASMSNNSVAIFNLLATPVNRAILTSLLETIHLYNLLPYDFVTSGVAKLACNLFDGKFCDLILQQIADADPTVDDTSRYDVYMSNVPAGAGYRNYLHYAQGINRKKEVFHRYDYGKNENLKRYGQETPPEYNLANLNFPIAILNGSLDKMADPTDVAWTVE